jgi:ribosomal-protein-serine acetyltransferase
VSRPERFDLGEGAELRRYTLEDAEELFALVEENRERLRRWLPWVDLTHSVDDERTWLATVGAVEDGMEGYGIFLDGRLAGGGGFRIGPFNIAGDIGYWIGEAFEGRGLVTKTCRAFIDYGFATVGLHRIVIRAAPENTRSRAVPERLGFTQEGVAREEGLAADGFHDLVVYGLLDRTSGLRPELKGL